MLNWFTPQKWRQSVPDSNASSREVPSVASVAEEDEDVEEDHVVQRESKYDVARTPGAPGGCLPYTHQISAEF